MCANVCSRHKYNTSITCPYIYVYIYIYIYMYVHNTYPSIYTYICIYIYILYIVVHKKAHATTNIHCLSVAWPAEECLRCCKHVLHRRNCSRQYITSTLREGVYGGKRLQLHVSRTPRCDKLSSWCSIYLSIYRSYLSDISIHLYLYMSS